MELFSIQNKNIVVTGASSGFGHHFAGVLSAAGANVVLGARRLEKIQARVTQINDDGGHAIGLALDVRDAKSTEQFLDAAENALAPGYILTDVSRLLFESERSEDFRKRIPMRRYGTFDDLDGPLMLVATDASRYMTGSTLVVDGGHICAEL